MTAHHLRAACAVVAALTVATPGLFLGDLHPYWYTLTAIPVLAGLWWLLSAAVREWAREQAEARPQFTVLDYHAVGRAVVRRPEYGRFA